jgi:hypothetical protein
MNQAGRMALFVFLVALAVQVMWRGRADMQLLIPAMLGVLAGGVAFTRSRTRV